MRYLLPLFALLATGCVSAEAPVHTQDQFFSRVSALCGQTFEGRVVSPPVEADGAFAGKRLVMHVRACSDDLVKIPFHVGDDRSRTWVLTRTPGGLRLKHDHRHEDGSEDALSQYGGDTVTVGSAGRQEFPADDFSRELFVARNLPQSLPNVWAIEAHPGASWPTSCAARDASSGSSSILPSPSLSPEQASPFRLAPQARPPYMALTFLDIVRR
jgi:hypothetical protein